MKKDQNEHGENVKKLNFFDLALIIAITAVVALLVYTGYQALPKNTEPTGDTVISYVITVTNVHNDVASQISTGQTVYDMNTGKVLGTVSAAVSTPYIVNGVDQETGAVVANPIDGKCNINITISAPVKNSNDAYRVNGITIACGLSYSFRTATAYMNGSCVSISQK